MVLKVSQGVQSLLHPDRLVVGLIAVLLDNPLAELAAGGAGLLVALAAVRVADLAIVAVDFGLAVLSSAGFLLRAALLPRFPSLFPVALLGLYCLTVFLFFERVFLVLRLGPVVSEDKLAVLVAGSVGRSCPALEQVSVVGTVFAGPVFLFSFSCV